MTDNIYKKLFEVKKAGIKLQKDTKAFNYKYATLTQIQEKLSSVLEEQNLVVVHYVKDLCMYTDIICIDNPESKVTSSIRMADGTKPQDKGSEVTYYRRYNLLSLLDLEIETDDDGKKAQESVKEDDNKEWYNDFDKHTDFYIKEIKAGKTADDLLKKLSDKYKVNKKIRQSMKDLETDNK